MDGEDFLFSKQKHISEDVAFDTMQEDIGKPLNLLDLT